MNSPSYRAASIIRWLRLRRGLVVVVSAGIELSVYKLDNLVNDDVPITQLHWVSIILAGIGFGLLGALAASVSATFLFYLANFLEKGRLLDWAVLPGVLLTLTLFMLVGVGTLAIIRLLHSLETSNKQLAENLQKLQASTARIELLTAERERNRLARELHDGVVKTLFGIEYTAGALEKVLLSSNSSTAPALQQARFIQEVSRQEGLAVRDLILNLRQGYDAPLPGLIKDYLKRWQLAYGQPVHFQSKGPDSVTSSAQAFEIMAILEEALENVRRHSQASAVWVALEYVVGQTLYLEIRDNGLGVRGEVQARLRERGYPGPILLDQPLSETNGRKHFGLTGMFERVAWLNGRMELTPAPEGGLQVRVGVPVAK